MTKLIVTPIDMGAPGSYRARKVLLDAVAAMSGSEAPEIAKAYQSIEATLLSRVSTDNGTSVEEALDECSADDFDRLIAGLLNVETVPNPNGVS